MKLATRLGSTALSVGCLAFPVILQQLIIAFQWRGSLLVVALIVLSTLSCGIVLHHRSAPKNLPSEVAEPTSVHTVEVLTVRNLVDLRMLVFALLNFAGQGVWPWAMAMPKFVLERPQLLIGDAQIDAALAATVISVCFIVDALVRFLLTVLEARQVALNPFLLIRSGMLAQAALLVGQFSCKWPHPLKCPTARGRGGGGS